jgi:hypothetical protein
MKWGWLCILLIFASCTNNEKIPSGVIERPEMEKIMWDMIRADRYSSIFLASDTLNRQRKTFELYENIFHIHHITKDEFLKSYKFYLGRPDLAKVMFDSVSARAERQRADVYKVPSKDSLAREKDSAMNRYRHALRDSAKKKSDSLRGRSGRLLNVRDSIKRRRDSILKVRSNSPLKVSAPKADSIKRNLIRPRRDTVRLK